MGATGARRAAALLVVGCVAVAIAIHVLDLARADERYRSHIEFAMDVVLPTAHWDPEVDRLSPSEAIERARPTKDAG